MRHFAFVRGRMMEAAKVTVPFDDLGFLRGYGVFDFLRTYRGEAFLLSEHLERFFASARTAGLEVPFTQKELRVIISKLIAREAPHECTVRLLLTAGRDAFFSEGTPKSSFFAVADRLHTPSDDVFRRGVRLLTLDFQRDLPTVKTLNYMRAFMATPALRRHRAFEALYAPGGFVREAATSNFFLVKNGRIATPKDNILLGTTRALVISLSRDAGIPVEEREIRLEEVASADEAFLTATNKDVLPVVKVDAVAIGKGRVGPVAKELLRRYRTYTESASTIK